MAKLSQNFPININWCHQFPYHLIFTRVLLVGLVFMWLFFCLLIKFLHNPSHKCKYFIYFSSLNFVLIGTEKCYTELDKYFPSFQIKQMPKLIHNSCIQILWEQSDKPACTKNLWLKLRLNKMFVNFRNVIIYIHFENIWQLSNPKHFVHYDFIQIFLFNKVR